MKFPSILPLREKEQEMAVSRDPQLICLSDLTALKAGKEEACGLWKCLVLLPQCPLSGLACAQVRKRIKSHWKASEHR